MDTEDITTIYKTIIYTMNKIQNVYTYLTTPRKLAYSVFVYQINEI